MSSLGMVSSIAKSAMSVQQRGMNVTAHNIANVNTPGYSKQSPIFSAKTPSSFSGMQMGSGAETTHVVRASNQYIENQLMREKSSMESSKEMENYIQILEGIFSENSDSGMNTILAGFWNLWNDLSNNPSGYSERIALYEHSLLVSEQFNALNLDLSQLETDITSTLGNGIAKVNQLSEEIATLNEQIISMEAGSMPNDIRDQRGVAISELSECIDVKIFGQDNGSITVVTAKGCILVQENHSYNLELGGANEDRIDWQGSGDAGVDITNQITNGKLGGWLTMRDEIVAKYKLDLDAMANELIWAVNQQHSQGVGLKLFEPGSTLTGTDQTSTDLGDLNYGDKIQFVADGFTLWVEDRTDPANPAIAEVSIDLSSLTSSASLSDLATLINNQIAAAAVAGVTADGSGVSLSFVSGSDYAFGFSDDQSNLLAALGINTFFQGVGAGSIDVNAFLQDKDYIAAAQIDADGNYASGDNTNALAVADLQFQSIQIAQWTCDRKSGDTEGSLTATIEGYYQAMTGSVGIIAASIYSSKSASETMVNNLTNIRDSISAISLDEEMTDLIKYQHAFGAAAKLISVVDEMFVTLLDIR